MRLFVVLLCVALIVSSTVTLVVIKATSNTLKKCGADVPKNEQRVQPNKRVM